MKHNRIYGVSAAEKGWVPSPSYLLRRNRVLKLMSEFPPGRLLEVGCGAGGLLNDLSAIGFKCEAYDSSPSAYELASYINRGDRNVKIFSEAQSGWDETFDYCVALEVLEHIEDDAAALRQWIGWIKPGGRLLLSVPAHQKRWSNDDVWAGHYRRYERKGLKSLLEQAGFSVDYMDSYGFPLSNVVDPVRVYYHSKEVERGGSSKSVDAAEAAGTARSGTERTLETRLYPLLTGWFGRSIMLASFFMQGLFSGTDLGTGYITVARRK